MPDSCCAIPAAPPNRSMPSKHGARGLDLAAYHWLRQFSIDRTAAHMRRWLADTHLVYRVASVIKYEDGTSPDPIDALFYAAGEVNEWRRINGLPHYIEYNTRSLGKGSVDDSHNAGEW